MMSRHRQRVGVLVDGRGRHLEAAQQSGEAIARALAERGHDAHPVFVDQDLDLALRQGRFDLAFLALRGRDGADGSVQGLLELLGIPYTGAGVFAAALATHPGKTRDLLRLANLPVAPGYVVRAGETRAVATQHAGFGFPVAVGPVGIEAGHPGGLARDEVELEAAVEEAFRFGGEALVERFVPGRMVAVAVLEGEAIGAADLGPLGAREDDRVSRARISAVRQPALLRLAEQCCRALEIDGPVLVQLVVSERHNEIVRGIDVTPWLVPTAPFARIATTAGVAFADLCETILAGARLRSPHGRKPRLQPWARPAVKAFDAGETAAPGRSGPCALPH